MFKLWIFVLIGLTFLSLVLWWWIVWKKPKLICWKKLTNGLVFSILIINGVFLIVISAWEIVSLVLLDYVRFLSVESIFKIRLCQYYLLKEVGSDLLMYWLLCSAVFHYFQYFRNLYHSIWILIFWNYESVVNHLI